MRKKTLRHIAGAVALVCLSGVSTVDAASVQTAFPSARPAITPALQDDDEIVFEPVEKNAEYYLGRRAALQEKLNRLDAKLGDDALKSAERAKLVAEITELHRAIALADDVDFSERWRSLENYSTNALVSRDVAGLESVKKDGSSLLLTGISDYSAHNVEPRLFKNLITHYSNYLPRVKIPIRHI